MKNNSIENELEEISVLLNSGELGEQQYCRLYVAQQGLAWAVNPENAKSPVATVIQGKVQAPFKEVEYLPIMDICASPACT